MENDNPADILRGVVNIIRLYSGVKLACGIVFDHLAYVNKIDLAVSVVVRVAEIDLNIPACEVSDDAVDILEVYLTVIIWHLRGLPPAISSSLKCS